MKSVFSMLFVLFLTNLFSQNVEYLSKTDRGNIIITQNNEIKGKDYLYDEWNKGMLVLNDSIFSMQDQLRFDAYKNRLLIKDKRNDNEVIEIKDKSITGFSIMEHNRNIKHDFVKLQNKNFVGEAENDFYELVFNLQNTNYFIKKTSIILFDPNRGKGSQTINNFPLEYQNKLTYYLKNSEGLYVEVRLKKNDILAVLNKHSKQMEAFVKMKKINYGKEDDVSKLVNYYYSL